MLPLADDVGAWASPAGLRPEVLLARCLPLTVAGPAVSEEGARPPQREMISHQSHLDL